MHTQTHTRARARASVRTHTHTNPVHCLSHCGGSGHVYLRGTHRGDPTGVRQTRRRQRKDGRVGHWLCADVGTGSVGVRGISVYPYCGWNSAQAGTIVRSNWVVAVVRTKAGINSARPSLHAARVRPRRRVRTNVCRARRPAVSAMPQRAKAKQELGGQTN